jgi:hypothetical protein
MAEHAAGTGTGAHGLGHIHGKRAPSMLLSSFREWMSVEPLTIRFIYLLSPSVAIPMTTVSGGLVFAMLYHKSVARLFIFAAFYGCEMLVSQVPDVL